MVEEIRRALNVAETRIVDGIADFLPGILALLLLLVTAVIVGAIVRYAVFRALQGLDFDRRAELLGVSLAGWTPSRSASRLVAAVAYWTILLIGLLLGLTALDAALLTRFATAVLEYVPHLVAALAILVVGGVIARFFARAVLIEAVNMRIQSARLLSLGVKWTVLIVAAAMALDHIGIGRIEDDVRESRVLIDVLDILPRSAAVGGAIESALAAGIPERAGSRHEHDLRIGRMDDDAADVLRFPETHVRPAFAAVLGLVDAVAPGCAALIVVLTRSYPDDLGIAWRNCDVADRRRALVIEDRLPGGAAVDGFPDTARCRRNVEQLAEPLTDLGCGPLGDREVDDAPARNRRSYRSPRQLGEPR